MREIFEFRIPEAHARAYLPDNAGVGLESGIASIGPTTRKLVLSPDDPLFADVGRIDRDFNARSRAFFTGWGVRRIYKKRELESAELFRAIVTHIFEPAGEECGTIYDDSVACDQCGGGAVRTSKLILSGKKLPRRANIGVAKSIAGEIVVSERFVQACELHQLRGTEFRPVYEQKSPSDAIPGWYELILTSPTVRIIAPTRTGSDPFDNESDSEHHCPRGDTIGLGIISELWVPRQDVEGSKTDIACTLQRTGVRRGLLRPEPALLISPRLWRAFNESGLKGLRFEVAHLK